MKKLILLQTLLFVFISYEIHAQAGHHFWVTGAYFGSNNYGTVLKSDSTGNQFVQVASFNHVNGSYPAGDIVMAGNGKLYGICEHGGIGNSCTLYSMDTATNIITKLHDFATSMSDGDIPMSGLVAGSDCKLYGNTVTGGANNCGVIYSFDPITNMYAVVHHFVDSAGKEPFGQLTRLGDGKIYGTTQHGGVNGVGTIFSFDPVTHTHKVLHHSDANTGGAFWYCKLIQAPDGKIYGTTPLGGLMGGGVLFSLDTATLDYTVLHDFTPSSEGSPYGKVAYAGGKIYGTTKGSFGFFGIIFSYDLPTDTFIVVKTFNGVDGKNPKRGLNLSSNGKLYGTTYEGGTHNYGVIFSFDPSTNTYNKILDFDSATTGARPDCDVIETGVAPNPCITLSMPMVNELHGFSVYPNPTQGEFTISCPDKEGRIEIYNSLGEKVFDSLIKDNNEVINCKKISSGLYFVKVSAGEKVFVQKLIKE